MYLSTSTYDVVTVYALRRNEVATFLLKIDAQVCEGETIIKL